MVRSLTFCQLNTARSSPYRPQWWRMASGNGVRGTRKSYSRAAELHIEELIECGLSLLGLAAKERRDVEIVGGDILADVANILLNFLHHVL